LFCDDRGKVVNCPDNAEIEDLVVLFSGGEIPYIIRPDHSPQSSNVKNFQFIGDSRVADVIGATIAMGDLAEESQWFTLT